MLDTNVASVYTAPTLEKAGNQPRAESLQRLLAACPLLEMQLYGFTGQVLFLGPGE